MTFTTKELRANGVDEQVIAIRQFRRQQKLSVKRFATMADISVCTWAYVETGKCKLTPLMAAKCEALMQRLAVMAEAKQSEEVTS